MANEPCSKYEGMAEKIEFLSGEVKQIKIDIDELKEDRTILKGQNETTERTLKKIEKKQDKMLETLVEIKINQAESGVRFEFTWKTIAALIGGVAVIIQILVPYIFGVPK